MPQGRVHARIVTVPNKDQDASLLDILGEATKVTAQSRVGVASWKLENLVQMSYLLVDGTAPASSVIVDGRALPKAAPDTPGLEVGNWASDQIGNRLVIHLPTHQGEHSEYLMEVDVDFKPS